MGLKDFYYLFEDKWYEILDKINEKVPIYKIIDPIDKLFPSFILFVVLILLIFGLLISSVVMPFLLPQKLIATVEVIDKDNLPIQDADIKLRLADSNNAAETAELLAEGITDEFGQFLVELPEDEIAVDIFVKPKDRKSVV